jgi:hypothetical protein
VENYFRVGQSTDDNWCLRVAFRLAEATNPHSQYVILPAFPLQQWLQELASVLHYIYTLPVFLCFLCVVIPFCGYVWVGLCMNAIGGIPSTLIAFLQFTYI